MPQTEPKRIGVSFEVKPHAYDPITNPELFDGVLARRVVAFFIDLIILSLPAVVLTLLFFVFAIVTFGLGAPLLLLLWPTIVIWALLYYGFTFGGPHSATVGMRMMDLEMRTWYGSPAYFLLGAMHGLLFWLTVGWLTPFILLVGFFNDRGRLLHDILLGTVVINNASRAQALRSSDRGI